MRYVFDLSPFLYRLNLVTNAGLLQMLTPGAEPQKQEAQPTL